MLFLVVMVAVVVVIVIVVVVLVAIIISHPWNPLLPTYLPGITALSLPDDTMKPSVDIMRSKRDRVMKALLSIPGVQCQTPQGAFYVLPDVSSYYGKTTPDGQVIRDGHELCMYLLKEYKVALVAGEAFGSPATIRISYATSIEELTTALERLKTCLGTLR